MDSDATTQLTATLSIAKTEREPMLSSLPPSSRVDFVLVTALPEERDAVLDKLPGCRQLPPAKDDIRTYFQADLPVTYPDNSTGIYRVVVMCLLGMGRVQAVTATADAIRRWRPHYILLVGIAGGIAARNVRVGDILISDQIVDYELQKLTSQGPEIRWEVQRADPRLLNACNNYRDERWQELIQIKRPDTTKPTRHTGPIASGDKVIAFSEVLARYRDVWPKLIGVEMEAAGVATAAFQSSDKPGFFMVRGVSDLADENKDSSDVEKWRSYACAAVASFVVTLLKNGPVPLSEGPIQEKIETFSGEPTTQVDHRIKTKRVELILEGEFGEFTSIRQQDVVGVLAALLRIDPSNIQVLKVYQGSIVIIIEIPDSAANRLYEMATTRDSRIMRLGLKSVLVEGREIIKFADRIAKIPGNIPEQLHSDTVVLWLLSVQDNILDILEWFAEWSPSLFGFLSLAIRWILIVVGPFVLGIMWKYEIELRYSQNQMLDIRRWLSVWPLFLFTIAYSIPIIWQKGASTRTWHMERLYSALRWFYEDMQFASDHNADIRCTIWIPTTNLMSKIRRDSSPKLMRQAVDYYPSKGRLRGVRSFRSNKPAGRVFQVSTTSKGVENPIGILGLCVVESIANHETQIYSERVPQGVNFFAYMCNNWNFIPRHARRLTSDRRAYLCIPMMDKGNSILLGVLYCDSRDPDALNTSIGESAQNYLPRFANLLTS